MFMLIYAASVCLFVPGTLLTAMGAAIFGRYSAIHKGLPCRAF
jgi:hypothetical protein